MKKVYVDVTYMSKLNFISGIQRVVLEVVKRFEKDDDIELILLKYNKKMNEFGRMSKLRIPGASEKIKVSPYSFDNIQAGDIWFEIDSVWPEMPKRRVLYEELKKKGVKIIPFIQDILLITDPQFFIKNAPLDFTGFTGACIAYADKIIVTTQATKDSMLEVAKQTGIKMPEICVVPLGNDFKSEEKTNAASKVDKDVVEFVKKHPKYVLMVGTVEPRKNQKIVIEAFEKQLFDEGLTLVMAGRNGWSNSALMELIEKSKKTRDNYAFFEGRSNEVINYLYENARILAFPSFAEGYGLPVVEALGRKVVVVASDRPIFHEIGGEGCMYCDPEDVDAWVKTLKKLMTDDKAYKGLKNKLKDYHVVSWDETANNLKNIILS